VAEEWASAAAFFFVFIGVLGLEKTLATPTASLTLPHTRIKN
jgi:hypothetical protein